MRTRSAIALVLVGSLAAGCAALVGGAIGAGVGFLVAGPAGVGPGAAGGSAAGLWTDILAFFSRLWAGLRHAFGGSGLVPAPSGGGKGGGGGGGAPDGFRWWDPAYWGGWVRLAVAVAVLVALYHFLRSERMAGFRAWFSEWLAGRFPSKKERARRGAEESPPKG